MKRTKVVAALAMAYMLAFVLVACADNEGSSSPDSPSNASTVGSLGTAVSDTAAALFALESVRSVEPIDVSASNFYVEKYLVTFEQPLDHENPSLGTFPQRVEVGIARDARLNVLETNGYRLRDEALATDDACELCQMFTGNYISVEHRFFGESRPEGLSNDGTEYWQYLTTKNEAADYHRIYTELSGVLGGPWAATGYSRGGEVCACYAYYYPEDMRLHLSYVAPSSEGPEDPRFYEYVYTAIGNEQYGAEKAKEYRDLVTSFQVELMRNKDILAPMLLRRALSEGYVYRESLSADELFDLTVLEMAVQEWQYGQKSRVTPEIDMSFKGLEQTLALPDRTEEEQAEKQEAELTLLYLLGSPKDWAANCMPWPYYVGAAKEYGQYHYDFSYLRAACEEAGIGDVLSVKPDEEDGFLFRSVLTPDQCAQFGYDGAFYEGITTWIETTDTRLVFVYGESDPWYSLRVHDTDNPSVRVAISGKSAHNVQISDLDEATRQEVVDFACEALFGVAETK